MVQDIDDPHRQETAERLARAGAAVIVRRSPNTARETAMRDDRRTAAEREFVLDQILTALWHGRLTRTVAIDRIMAELGLSQGEAQAEVDGFLQD
jgi:NAD(P)-dependent dehydrogenase (short-subunit alcohol dehydrogenase family)